VAKPVYSLLYAILITLGLLALILFNRMISSDEAAPAAQASLQRNETTAREAREAVAESAEKAAQAEAADKAAEKPAEPPVAAGADKPDASTAAAKDDEERK
jgi:hypothetical protein